MFVLVFSSSVLFLALVAHLNAEKTIPQIRTVVNFKLNPGNWSTTTHQTKSRCLRLSICSCSIPNLRLLVRNKCAAWQLLFNHGCRWVVLFILQSGQFAPDDELQQRISNLQYWAIQGAGKHKYDWTMLTQNHVTVTIHKFGCVSLCFVEPRRIQRGNRDCSVIFQVQPDCHCWWWRWPCLQR